MSRMTPSSKYPVRNPRHPYWSLFEQGRGEIRQGWHSFLWVELLHLLLGVHDQCSEPRCAWVLYLIQGVLDSYFEYEHIFMRHTLMYTPMNIKNQLRRPFQSIYWKCLMIWPHLANILRCVTQLNFQCQTDKLTHKTDTTQIKYTRIWGFSAPFILANLRGFGWPPFLPCRLLAHSFSI